MVPDNMGRVAIVCVLSVFLCVRAVAQEGYYGVGHDRWHREFYSKLNRNDGKGTCCDLMDCRLDVVWRVVTPVHDQEILDAADDEQLAVGDEAEVSGPQPRPFGCVVGCRRDKFPPEGTFRFVRSVPITDGDVVALRPDLTDRPVGTLGASLRIDDPQDR